MQHEGANPYPAMDRMKSLRESWEELPQLVSPTDKLRKRLGTSPNSADHNPISTGTTINGTDDTDIHNTFSNMNVQDASLQTKHLNHQKLAVPVWKDKALI